MSQNVLGKNIRRLRREAGFSRTAFAFMVGVSVQTVQWWETGRVLPKPENIELILRVLNTRVRCTRDDLFAETAPLTKAG